MKAVLVVNNGVHIGREISLGATQFMVGRATHCDLRPKSEEIGRMHCVFYIDSSTVSIHDLDCEGGTKVNGRPIEGAVQLASGDRINIGPLEFKLKVYEDAELTPIPTSSSSSILAAGRKKRPSGEVDIHSGDAWITDFITNSSSGIRRTLQTASNSAKRLVKYFTDQRRTARGPHFSAKGSVRLRSRKPRAE